MVTSHVHALSKMLLIRASISDGGSGGVELTSGGGSGGGELTSGGGSGGVELTSGGTVKLPNSGPFVT